ncbi:MAG: C-terminal helicase domain-containing protein [Opitutaceae bacterium]|nr:C-terminal helicase domain-containing protein [Opitutaceae bacterium]
MSAEPKIRPAQRAAVLRAQLLPVMIRRKKSDVLPELPPQVHEWRQLAWADNDETRRLLDAVDNDLGQCAAATDDVTRGGAFMRAVHHLGQAKALAPSLCEHVVARARAGRPTLVFAKHLSVVKSLREQFAAAGVRVVVVTGKVPAKERGQAYEDFHAGRAEVFLGTIDAAGESESLTAADEVVFAELHWVPAALEQAAGRGHRLGQRSKTYSIVYYHAAHPIDEVMMNTIRRKLGYIGDVLTDPEAISLRDLITMVLRRHGGPHSPSNGAPSPVRPLT